jgi:hypothetical protein
MSQSVTVKFVPAKATPDEIDRCISAFNTEVLKGNLLALKTVTGRRTDWVLSYESPAKPGVPYFYRKIRLNPQGHSLGVNTRDKDTHFSVWVLTSLLTFIAKHCGSCGSNIVQFFNQEPLTVGLEFKHPDFPEFLSTVEEFQIQPDAHTFPPEFPLQEQLDEIVRRRSRLATETN